MEADKSFTLSSGATIRSTLACKVPQEVEISEKGVKFSNQRNGRVGELNIRDAKRVELLPEIGATFPNLLELQVINCSLMTLDERDFQLLSNLLVLNMTNNQLRSLDDANVFDTLENLEELSLGSNRIEYLDQKIFSKLRKLRSLDLQRNKLAQLDVDTFNSNVNLQFLYLSFNKLTRLKLGIFDPLKNLEVLSLDDNELTSLPSRIFDKCKSLSVLNLSWNKIIDINLVQLANLPALRTVRFSGNPLASIDFAIFDYNREIHKIYLDQIGDIAIKNIDKVDGMDKLHFIDFRDNSCIDAAFKYDVLEDLSTHVKAHCRHF